MGLPLSAKNVVPDKLTPLASSKAATRGIPSSRAARSSSVAQAKKQSHEKSEVAVTPDISKTAASSSLVSKQESSLSTPSRTVRSEERTGTETSFTSGGRLARVTAYWAAEGDYYTGRGISATGVRLHDGHCAVDPRIIPYGSVVEIAGVGKFLAVDTGSAVISRVAAREGGHTSAERNALVVDVYFESRVDGEKFAAGTSKFVSISWWTPTSMGREAQAARSLFADENWNKIQGKQL